MAVLASWPTMLSNLLVGKIDGVLLDLGVSSPQLDDAERGFSFLRDGPLDMRMDNSQGETAAQWLARAEVEDMAWVFKTYGEEKNARHIARCIAADRDEKPFLRTKDLAGLIERITKHKERNKHPATRVFQAIRIYINSELDQIDQALEGALQVLAPKGRLSIISFHSLEDRMVKRFIRRHSKGEEVPYGLPVTETELNRSRQLLPIGKAMKPSDEEIALMPGPQFCTQNCRAFALLRLTVSKSQLNLARIVLQDLWQHKWILLLGMLVLGNAVAVVYTSHISRTQTSELDKLLQERDRLDIEWRNLLLEEQSQAEHSRITRIATKELDMIRPLPNEEVVVRLP